MHMLCRHQLALQGRVTAGEDAHLRLSGQFAHDAGVLLRQGQRHIAGDGCQAQHRQVFRAGKGQQDRHGIILPRIGVDDDLSCHGCRPSPVSGAGKPMGGGLSMTGMGRGGCPAPKDQPSKLISSMIFSATGRSAAMSISGSVSGVKEPQLATSAETGTPGLTGNSWLVSA